MAMISDPDDFFTKGCGRCDRFATPDCSTRPWIEGLTNLRRVCLGMGLVETVKWAHPVYMHVGRNIALLSAFRTDFRLTFMNARLLTDSEGVLEPQGPNELTEALDADPELAEAFQALTPGRQKSYLFNLNQAKQPATRMARIEKFRGRILEGKGLLER